MFRASGLPYPRGTAGRIRPSQTRIACALHVLEPGPALLLVKETFGDPRFLALSRELWSC